MFTGIVAATGRLRSRESFNGDLRIRFEVPEELMAGCKVGDSICVSGCCLTMLDPDATGFSADLSVETLDKTSLGTRREGDSVNLELAMRASDRLGGHLVSGHVDGLATLVSRARYIAPKGSACLDGVSLTVNDVEDNRFSICVIPHTLVVTTLGSLSPGEQVNLEVDLIARYLDRLNQYDHPDEIGA
jgi:riboflavin synthase